MNIIERPLAAGNQFNNPELVVLHAMAEYINDPSPIFAPNFLEKYGLSAHALIVPNGDVMICRSEQSGAYHARGFNTNSLGVEFLVPGDHDYGTFIEAMKTDYVTPEAWAAGVELVKGWCEKWGIDPYDSDEKKGVKRHSDISPGRKSDPGNGFDFSNFLTQITN